MAHWPLAVLRRGAPVTEASDIPILMLSEAASETVKMVLTGEGSDELMGGYPKYRAEPWIKFYQRIVPHFLHDRIITPAVRSLPYCMRRVKIICAVANEREIANRMRAWFGGMSIEGLEAILGQTVSIEPPDPYPFSACMSNLRQMLFFDQTSWLPDNLLERGDRMMMAGSVEGRMPFMDTVLAGVVARFPDEFLIGRGGKRVLRAAMSKHLPREILSRKKVGFRVPFNEWFRGPYREFIQDMLMSKSSYVGQICNGRLIRGFVNEHIEGRINNEKILWSLTNLELFLREFRPSNLPIERPNSN